MEIYCVLILKAGSPNQVVNRVVSFWGLWGRLYSRSLSLAYRWLSSLCVFTSFSLYICHCIQSSLFYEETSHTGLGTTLMALVKLDYFYKHPISKSHILRFWGLKLQHMNLKRTQFNPEQLYGYFCTISYNYMTIYNYFKIKSF